MSLQKVANGIRIDPPNDAFEAQNIEHLAKVGRLGQVQPQAVVPEVLAGKQKIPGAATQVENGLAGRPIQVQGTGLFDCMLQPRAGLDVFGPSHLFAGHFVLGPDTIQAGRVDFLQ